MDRIDLRATLRHLYAPSANEVSEVVVPSLRFLSIDGQGAPESTAYTAAVQALYTLAYGVKFALKRTASVDLRVMPLEGLWWADDHTVFHAGDRAAWQWRMMIAQPEPVDDAVVKRVREDAIRRKRLPALSRVRLDIFDEGRAAQILYIGPYSDEGPTIARLHRYIEERDGRLTSHHHEIYLSDPSRTAPEKLKTILRQPFR